MLSSLSIYYKISVYKHLLYPSVEPSDSLNVPGSGSGTIRKCGLVRVGVVLLEEVCHCGRGL